MLADHLDQGVPSMALVGGNETRRSELCDRLGKEKGLTIFEAKPMPEPMAVIGNVPAKVDMGEVVQGANDEVIDQHVDSPWISAFVPSLPAVGSRQMSLRSTPRLITRLQQTSANNRWPAPHQMWPSGWDWPEYRLELDDMDWAVSEVASAMDSMRCPLEPVTDDGSWWQ